jgi:hypothetical protein
VRGERERNGEGRREEKREEERRREKKREERKGEWYIPRIQPSRQKQQPL